MSTAPTADPAVPVEPTAAPAPAPVAAPAPDMISVPADQMDSYGRDWHKVMADAKYGREARDNGLFEIAQRLNAEGMSPREYLAFLDNYEPGQVQTAPQLPAAPEVSVPPALTEDKVRELMSGVLREDREQRSQTDLRQDEATHRAKFLDEQKLTVGEDGKGSLRRGAAEAIYERMTVDALQAALPSYASDEDKANAARGLASPEILAEADRRWKETWTDMGNEAVAAVVTDQESVPDATLSGGPGGSEPPVAWDDMSEAQRKAGVLAGVDGPLD